MAANAALRRTIARRRMTAVVVALALSATSIVAVSEPSKADGPLDPLAPVTQAVAPVTQAVAPVTQAVAPATQPVTQTVTTATQPVSTATQPVTQAVSTATKPVTQTVTTATQPVTTATKPATQTVATATKPATQAVAAAVKPVTQAVKTAVKPVTQAVNTAVKPVKQAVAAVAKPVAKPLAQTANAIVKPALQAVASVTQPVKRSVNTTVAKASATSAHAAAVKAPSTRATRTKVTGGAKHVKRAQSATKTGASAPPRTKHVTSAANAPARSERTSAAKRNHVVKVVGNAISRAAGGGHAVIATPRTRPTALAVEQPVADAVAEIGSAPAPALAASAPVSAQPSGGGSSSSSTGLGLAALIGAGGAALLRARAMYGATGLDDTGTLTALAHSASTMWAGSCYTVGSSATLSATPMTASFVSDAISPASALGSRAEFGVKGVVSGAADAVGGRVVSPAAAFARDTTGNDRTLLVAALLTASAAIGAVLGAIGPRGSGASAGDAR